MSSSLYFDHAAATPVRPEVWQKVQSLQSDLLGNPSSVHGPGVQVRGLIDQARITLAPLFLGQPSEVIFTSGATEALNLAIVGGYLALKQPKKVVYSTPIGHSCIQASLRYLEKIHGVEIRTLPLTNSGHLALDGITETVVREGDLVVVEHLNSETGALQPVAKMGKSLIRIADEIELVKPIFIVDAAASVVGESVGLEFQKCDFLSISGEKFGALSGTGLLLKRSNVDLQPLLGGTQEWGFRAGSENVLGILSLAAALTAHSLQQDAQNHQHEIYFNRIATTLKDLGCQIVTPEEGRGHHLIQAILPAGFSSSLFVVQADLAGLAISAGSACSSGSVEGSRVLQQLGYSVEASQRGLRISWGWSTSVAEVEQLQETLKKLLK